MVESERLYREGGISVRCVQILPCKFMAKFGKIM